MSDVLLSSLRVSPGTDRIFEVAGLRTASIRDQMVRAHVLVERLFQKRQIGAGVDLLVVGGGAGGVTAAMTAGELGVKVMLCEAKTHFFGRQAQSSRYVDPTEYDWPQPHWKVGTFPWTLPHMPLPFPAATAEVLAQHWHGTFARWLKTPNGRNVTVYRGAPIHAADVTDHGTHLELLSGHVPDGPHRFGAAASFAGFLREKVAAPETGKPQYQGFPYWSRDPYDLPDLDLPGRDKVSVLISGGGDGALQDFIRVLTGRSAKACHAELTAAGLFEPIDLVLAEDLAKRSHAWRSRAAPHLALQLWHKTYDKHAQANWDHWRSSSPNVVETLAKRLLRRNVAATLLLACSHADFTFGLNRWVALHLARVSAHSRGISLADVVRHNSALSRVEAADAHTCKSASACHGRKHLAYAVQSTCQLRSHDEFKVGEFDCIIVRHGVVANRLFGSASVPEQMVPFHVPI